jgi:hypothetical protein
MGAAATARALMSRPATAGLLLLALLPLVVALVVRHESPRGGHGILSDSAAAGAVSGTAADADGAGAAANRRVPTRAELARLRASGNRNPYLAHVTGAYTGGTDRILRWAAAKWSLDVRVLRAVAVTESGGRQSAVGDDGRSFGLMQVKRRLPGDRVVGWAGTFPLSRDSTAFNVDYYAAELRACLDDPAGYEDWIDAVPGGVPFRRGDLWGCVGLWYAGRWHTAAADAYAALVRSRVR